MTDTQKDSDLPDLKDSLKTKLGPGFTLEHELGGGGMSRVFVTRDNSLDRQVVVKVLHADIAAEVSSERFRREVQLAAKLQHPHIVPLISSGEVDGLPYFLMPFIDGESLRERLVREGELPVKDAIGILRDVASAISYAHRQGIVHRDIKPENILLSDDFAVVTDFGIAKALSDSTMTAHSSGLTTRGVALGTPAYMAPEQAAADPSLDQRADIYSFGIVAYEVLTGATPFAGRPVQALMAAHAVQSPESIDRRRPGLPPALASMIMQCLEKRPSDRPQNAALLIAALESIPTSGPFTAANELTPAGSEKPGARLGALGNWTRLVLGLTALLLVGIAVIYLRRNALPAGTASPSSIGSIAVLPLANLSGNSEDEYFSEGMTDELANALSKIPHLNVASRTSSYSFKNAKNLDLAEVGRKLNVRTVVEGSVRRAGNKLRVHAQLTDITNGFVMWSKTFDGDARDVFKFQDQIAVSVADALRSHLAIDTAEIMDARGTQDLRAFDSYLRGRYFWHLRGGPNLFNAVNYFKAALAQDPTFARAYAGLAISYALLPEYSTLSPEESTKEALAAADKALALDSSLAEAYTAKGLAYMHSWQPGKAAAEYDRAIAFDPRYPTAHQWKGEYWLEMDQVDSGLAEIKRAASLDPLAPINGSALTYTLTISGRYDDAIAESRKGIELTPTLGQTHSMLANAYYGKGQKDSALREAEIALRLDPGIPYRHGQTGFIAGKNGDAKTAARELQYLKATFTRSPFPRFAFLLAYLGVGDRESALIQLENSIREKDLDLTSQSLTRDPLLAEFQGDPRFQRLVAEKKALFR